MVYRFGDSLACWIRFGASSLLFEIKLTEELPMPLNGVIITIAVRRFVSVVVFYRIKFLSKSQMKVKALIRMQCRIK